MCCCERSPVASLLVTGVVFLIFCTFSGFEYWNSQWLSRGNLDFIARQHTTRDIDIASLSVCPSVPDVPVSDEKGLTYCRSFFHHTVAQTFCFYPHQTRSRNSDGVTPCKGTKYRWGIKISRFSTNKSLYLANDTIYRHGYYRRRIGNRTQAFEWHQFQ